MSRRHENMPADAEERVIDPSSSSGPAIVSEIPHMPGAPSGPGNWPGPASAYKLQQSEEYAKLYKDCVTLDKIWSQNAELRLSTHEQELLAAYKRERGIPDDKSPLNIEEFSAVLDAPKLACNILKALKHPYVSIQKRDATARMKMLKYEIETLEAHKSVCRGGGGTIPIKSDPSKEPECYRSPIPANELQMKQPAVPKTGGTLPMAAYNEGYADGFNIGLQFSNTAVLQLKNLEEENRTLKQRLGIVSADQGNSGNPVDFGNYAGFGNLNRPNLDEHRDPIRSTGTRPREAINAVDDRGLARTPHDNHSGVRHTSVNSVGNSGSSGHATPTPSRMIPGRSTQIGGKGDHSSTRLGKRKPDALDSQETAGQDGHTPRPLKAARISRPPQAGRQTGVQPPSNSAGSSRAVASSDIDPWGPHTRITNPSQTNHPFPAVASSDINPWGPHTRITKPSQTNHPFPSQTSDLDGAADVESSQRNHGPAQSRVYENSPARLQRPVPGSRDRNDGGSISRGLSQELRDPGRIIAGRADQSREHEHQPRPQAIQRLVGASDNQSDEAVVSDHLSPRPRGVRKSIENRDVQTLKSRPSVQRLPHSLPTSENLNDEGAVSESAGLRGVQKPSGNRVIQPRESVNPPRAEGLQGPVPVPGNRNPGGAPIHPSPVLPSPGPVIDNSNDQRGEFEYPLEGLQGSGTGFLGREPMGNVSSSQSQEVPQVAPPMVPRYTDEELENDPLLRALQGLGQREDEDEDGMWSD